MRDPKNIIPYQWKKGQSGNPKGRPPNRVPKQLENIFGSKVKARNFLNLSNIEIDEWEKAVLSLAAPQLSKLAKWEDAPMYPRNLAIAIISDIKNGVTKTIDKLRDRQFGESKKQIDITTNGSDINKEAFVLNFVSNPEDFKKIQEEVQSEKERKEKEQQEQETGNDE